MIKRFLCLLILFCTLLISDIICANPDSHDFQMKQRTQKYNDLKHAVQILRYAREDSPIGNVFLKMYLLESGQIKFEQYKVKILSFPHATWSMGDIALLTVCMWMFECYNVYILFTYIVYLKYCVSKSIANIWDTLYSNVYTI